MGKKKFPWSKKVQKEYTLSRKYAVLGEYLAIMRNKAGLTQRQVRLALDYSSAQFISNFERGIAVPPLKKLKKIVKLYALDKDLITDLILKAEAEAMRKVLLGKGSPRTH